LTSATGVVVELGHDGEIVAVLGQRQMRRMARRRDLLGDLELLRVEDDGLVRLLGVDVRLGEVGVELEHVRGQAARRDLAGELEAAHVDDVDLIGAFAHDVGAIVETARARIVVGGVTTGDGDERKYGEQDSLAHLLSSGEVMRSGREAGLLAFGSTLARHLAPTFPVDNGRVVLLWRRRTDYSGGTAPDSHRLPLASRHYSIVGRDEYARRVAGVKRYHVTTRAHSFLRSSKLSP
jgi:hypothetical protein